MVQTVRILKSSIKEFRIRKEVSLRSDGVGNTVTLDDIPCFFILSARKPLKIFRMVKLMFSKEELIKIINCQSIGSFFPYHGGSEEDIEKYIKAIITDINNSSIIQADADYSMYGSGYASYVDVFCYKKDGTSTVQKDGVYYISGILLYICRLAPVAVFGKDEISRHSRGGLTWVS